MSVKILSINPERFLEDFNALAQIGATGDGGVNRPTFSEAHLAARKWFGERAAEAGLEVHVDGAGNHSAILRKEGASKSILLGSHLDSVPNGGRFDGALGVVSALEVLRTIKESGLELPVNLEAIDFTDEESSLIQFMGSHALLGLLTPAILRSPHGGRTALLEGLNRAGLTEDGLLSSRRDPDTIAGYLELHIEQSRKLENADIQIGIVTGIVGIYSFRLSFYGRADHSGTTPMEARADAGLGASSFVIASRDIIMRQFPDCVANVGNMEFRPGVSNVVPKQVDVLLEIRSVDGERLNALKSAIMDQAQHDAEQFDLDLKVQTLGGSEPASMSLCAQAAIRSSAEALGLRHMSISSGAGHDAQLLSRITPTGMIFVPSIGGVSHSPVEFTEWEDCVNGANVLLGATLRLVGKE
ncbi:MAG: Zn-dependent hydrolase [Anaerolineales bacterium]|nr:MAG: Zn-dependent hydrolase [Anaerolineales bacterium]